MNFITFCSNGSAIFTMDDTSKWYAPVYWVEIGKSASEIPELLRRVFGQHSFGRIQVCEWHGYLKVDRASFKITSVQGVQSSTKRQKMWQKSWTLLWGPFQGNPLALSHKCDQLYNLTWGRHVRTGLFYRICFWIVLSYLSVTKIYISHRGK